jgi:predicted alpha/beta-hydrolase family hydrolase
MPTVPLSVSTPRGPGRFFVDAATDPHSILVLGHGAGGGIGAADLELLARQFPPQRRGQGGLPDGLGPSSARSRLPGVPVAPPRLVLQGTSDSFGTPEEIRAAMGVAPGIRIVELPGADHGFRLGENAGFTAADLRLRVLAEVTGFLAGYRE